MIHWFSPGFSDCTQRSKTRLMSSILLDADMGWGVHAAARFDSVPDLNLVVCDRNSFLNVEFEIVQYIVFSIVRDNISIPTWDTCYRRRSWYQARAWTDLPQILVSKPQAIIILRWGRSRSRNREPGLRYQLLPSSSPISQDWQTTSSCLAQYKTQLIMMIQKHI